MSKSSGVDLFKDLELEFLPAWAQKSTETNPYADFKGEQPHSPRNRDRGDWNRGPKPRQGGRDRDFQGRKTGRSDRDPRDRREPSRSGPPERQGAPGRDRSRRPERDGRFDRAQRPSRQDIQVEVSIIPEKKGSELLARQIKLTGRAYPLFEIARLVLAKPERYQVILKTIKKPDGSVAQPLFFCQVDDTIWLSLDAAARHVLDQHFDTFYRIEKTAIDPPKGTYTFVAQCGMSGVILGPPNYHGYQEKLRTLHADRFFRLPFEVFKSRVRIVRDEETVKQWVEEQSWKTEYTTLNLPEEERLASRDGVREHFTQHHQDNLISKVDDVALAGAVFLRRIPPTLHGQARREIDYQRRFPLKVVNVLSQEFSSHGLQFFKRGKGVTHVAVSRPRYLDMEITPVSDSIRQIVEFIGKTPNCTRRMILEHLAPESAVADPGSHAKDKQEDASDGQAPLEKVSPEHAALLSDLHWLIHQGHVIEFANGIMETTSKPPMSQPRGTGKKSKKSGVKKRAEDSKKGAAVSPKTKPTSSAPGEEEKAVSNEPSVEPLPSKAELTSKETEPQAVETEMPEPVAKISLESHLSDAETEPAPPDLQPEQGAPQLPPQETESRSVEAEPPKSAAETPAESSVPSAQTESAPGEAASLDPQPEQAAPQLPPQEAESCSVETESPESAVETPPELPVPGSEPQAALGEPAASDPQPEKADTGSVLKS